MSTGEKEMLSGYSGRKTENKNTTGLIEKDIFKPKLILKKGKCKKIEPNTNPVIQNVTVIYMELQTMATVETRADRRIESPLQDLKSCLRSPDCKCLQDCMVKKRMKQL